MTSIQERFDALVSGVDYPMFVVTTAAGEERSGCLVGFVTQASIDPPRLLVMLSVENHTYRVARNAATLAVHFLHKDNHRLAEVFGEESGDWTDKFRGCDWSQGPDGVPVLAGTRGWVMGRILERFPAGDHVGHLLETVDVGTGADGPPLTFQAVRDLSPGHPA